MKLLLIIIGAVIAMMMVAGLATFIYGILTAEQVPPEVDI